MMVSTRHTDERFAIRQLVDVRQNGWSLLRSFFIGLTRTEDRGIDPKTLRPLAVLIPEPIVIDESDLMAIYTGQPIEEDKWGLVKRVLRERMPRET